MRAAASAPDAKDLVKSHLGIFLDPEDPAVQTQAARDGIPDDWIAAARRSPVYALAVTYRVALPLHPEYRTLPMVWYVPPLSPVVEALDQVGYESDADDVFPAIEQLRIPVDYLANLLAAGDSELIRSVLKRLAAMRSFMRRREVGGEVDRSIADAVGMSVAEMEAMYRLLAIGKYEDRYVIPPAHTEQASRLMEQQGGGCSLEFEGGPGMGGAFGAATRKPLGETFMLRPVPSRKPKEPNQ